MQRINFLRTINYGFILLTGGLLGGAEKEFLNSPTQNLVSD